MGVLGYRSLKYPDVPDRGKPDYDGQRERYRAENRVWWDNWEHNFVLSLKLLLAAFATAIVVVFVIALG